jgi:hypothetical protein
VLHLADKYQLSLATERKAISAASARIPGTSACLQQGLSYTV